MAKFTGKREGQNSEITTSPFNEPRHNEIKAKESDMMKYEFNESNTKTKRL